MDEKSQIVNFIYAKDAKGFDNFEGISFSDV